MRDWLVRKFADRREEGTALLTAILMTAFMAVIAVSLIDQTRFALFRTANMDRRDQAYWYAMGARDFSESILLRSGPADRLVMRPQEPWLIGPRQFAIEGGQLRGHVRDGNNCLNVNALAGNAGAAPEAPGRGLDMRSTQLMFSALLDRLGVAPDQIEPLKAQIIDWIDANTFQEAGGAEDQTYLGFEPPLRAANQPMVELEELRVLPVVTPGLYARISPYLCVRDQRTQPPLNVNTLQPDQAVLLSALFGGRLSVGDAEAVLLQRPPTGYEAAAELFDHPLIAALEPDLALRDAVTVRTQWFDIEVEVELGETAFSLSERVELTQDGRLRRHAQRFGAVQ